MILFDISISILDSIQHLQLDSNLHAISTTTATRNKTGCGLPHNVIKLNILPKCQGWSCGVSFALFGYSRRGSSLDSGQFFLVHDSLRGIRSVSKSAIVIHREIRRGTVKWKCDTLYWCQWGLKSEPLDSNKLILLPKMCEKI